MDIWVAAGVEFGLSVAIALVGYGMLQNQVRNNDKRMNELEAQIRGMANEKRVDEVEAQIRDMASRREFEACLDKIAGLEAHIMRLIEMVAEMRGQQDQRDLRDHK